MANYEHPIWGEMAEGEIKAFSYSVNPYFSNKIAGTVQRWPASFEVVFDDGTNGMQYDNGVVSVYHRGGASTHLHPERQIGCYEPNFAADLAAERKLSDSFADGHWPETEPEEEEY